jgi:hypothetical protein
MSAHVAVLENRDGFDPKTIREHNVIQGIVALIGCRHGSKTSEGIEYHFAADSYTPERAKAWLAERFVAHRSFSAASDDALVLEADGTYTLRGVEVAEEGTWYADVGGKVELTAAMLDRATDETNAAIEMLRPALTLGHLKGGEQWIGVPDGGQPRLGFATKVYRAGKKVLCDLRKVPPSIVKAIRMGLWGRISPDIMLGWPDPQTKERRPIVFTAFALLGATPPAISTLQDLSDWIDGQHVTKPAEAEMALSLALSDVVSVVECGASGAAVPGQNEGNGTDGTQAPEQGEVQMNEEQIIALVKKLIAEALAGSGEPEMAAKATAEMAALRGEMYTARLTRAATEGKIKPAEVEPMAKGLIEMSHATATATLAAIEARDGKIHPVGPIGNQPPPDPLGNLEGESKLIAMAQGLCKAEQISFRDAWIRIGNEHPDEYRAYRTKAFPTVGTNKES